MIVLCRRSRIVNDCRLACTTLLRDPLLKQRTSLAAAAKTVDKPQTTRNRYCNELAHELFDHLDPSLVTIVSCSASTAVFNKTTNGQEEAQVK